MTHSLTTNRNRWAFAGIGGALVLLAGVIVGGILGPALTSGSEVYLCNGNQNAKAIKLDGGTAADPTIRKIVKDCVFHDLSENAIVINRAENVLVTGSTFRNIHSGQGGTGSPGFGLYIRGQAQSHNITVENSLFEDLGADGIQVADGGRLVSGLVIRGNIFRGHVTRAAPYNWVGGENAIDIKGANGPVLIEDNEVSGFTPCANNGSAECSGSNGTGIVVHDGAASGYANDVTLRANWIHHNVPYGLIVSHSTGTVIVGNVFTDNGSTHLIVTSNASGCTASGNTFDNSAGTEGLSRCGAAASASPAPTATPAPSPTRSPSPVPTATPTASPSPSPSPSPTLTPVPTSSTSPAPTPAFVLALSDYSVTRSQSFNVSYRTTVASRVRFTPVSGSCPIIVVRVTAGNGTYLAPPVTCRATYRVQLRDGSGGLLASAPNLVVT